MELNTHYKTVEFDFLNEIRLLKDILRDSKNDSDDDMLTDFVEDLYDNFCEFYHDSKDDWDANVKTSMNFDEEEYRAIQDILISSALNGLGFSLDPSEGCAFFDSLCAEFEVSGIIATLRNEIDAVNEALEEAEDEEMFADEEDEDDEDDDEDDYPPIYPDKAEEVAPPKCPPCCPMNPINR